MASSGALVASNIWKIGNEDDFFGIVPEKACIYLFVCVCWGQGGGSRIKENKQNKMA